MVEIKQWAAYRARRGSLNIGRRIEQTGANMMSVHLNIGRQPDTMIDPIELMPYEDDVVESFEDQIDD